MADRAKSCTDRDVKTFLERKERHYLRLLKHIESILEDLKNSPEGQKIGLRMYSRGDKQDGSEFKEPWKIAAKVNQKRFGKRIWMKEEIEPETTPEPTYKIHELGDIVGLAAVVLYNSDIDVVREHIDQKIGSKILRSYHDPISGQFGEPKSDNGYYAYHYQLGHRDPMVRNIRCELQIKTALHDALGAKTHDLTYKPQGELDARLQKQIEVLGDALESFERQSELLKSLIQEQWLGDQKRRKIAAYQLFVRAPTTKSKKAGEYIKIRDQINKRVSDVRNDKNQDLIDRIVARIDRFAGTVSYDHDACRLITLLAAKSSNSETTNIALDRIEEWWLSATNRHEKLEASHFKSLAHYCFGQVVEAIAEEEAALHDFLPYAAKPDVPDETKEKIETLILAAQSSLAYYYAEIAGSDAANKLGARNRAMHLVEEAKKTAKNMGLADAKTADSDARKWVLEDTFGAVKIAFASTVEEVHSNLGRCQEAHQNAVNLFPHMAELFAAYLELHERRAYRKIVELES